MTSWQDLCKRSRGKISVQDLAILCLNLQEKWPRTPPGTSFCASLHSRKAHGHFTKTILWKFTGQVPDANPATPVLCGEPAQSKCTWTFHKSHFVWKFTRKIPDATETTSIEHRALTLTVRTPQCGYQTLSTKSSTHAMTATEVSSPDPADHQPRLCYEGATWVPWKQWNMMELEHVNKFPSAFCNISSNGRCLFLIIPARAISQAKTWQFISYLPTICQATDSTCGTRPLHLQQRISLQHRRWKEVCSFASGATGK